MRKILLGLVVTFIIIFSFSAAHSQTNYTYDSIIDPAKFQNWKELTRVRTGLNEGMVSFENPDKNAVIKVVILLMRNHWLITYEYIIDGVKYKYEYDFDAKHFGLVSEETSGQKV